MLPEISFITINEDKVKFPVFKGDEVSRNIALKIIQNPSRVGDLEELYDIFEVNKGSNVKYLLCYNPIDQFKNPADMPLQAKLFRKFFYENSSFIETEFKFLEITNKRVAERAFGKEFTEDQQILIVQNVNPYGKLENS